jgi:hypothetical protein
MKTELKVDTESIVNRCALSAKFSHGKISAFHLTLRRPFVEGLGMHSGDTVDIAVLQINHPTPEIASAAAIAVEPYVVEAIAQESHTEKTPSVLTSPQKRVPKSPKSSPKKSPRGGSRGKSKRGKRGKTSKK